MPAPTGTSLSALESEKKSRSKKWTAAFVLKPERSVQVRHAATTAALIWFSTSIMAAILVGACFVYTSIRYPQDAAVVHPYSPRAQASAIHSLSASDAAKLFEDFDDLEAHRMYVYEPWVGFSERIFHSRFLNIDDDQPLPVRRTVESAGAGVDKTIWLFGGSTQFGWGVPDNETIASQLSTILAADGLHYTVVNYGHTEFYSTQEATFFATLLRHGRKCDVAVFLDGLNDSRISSSDVPPMSVATSLGFLEEEDTAAALNSKYFIITPLFPPVRVADGVLRRLVPSRRHERREVATLSSETFDPIGIYQFNMRMIRSLAEDHRIHVLFYWQPTAFDHMTGSHERSKSLPCSENIPVLNDAVRKRVRDESFHSIADMFEQASYDDIYVDLAHYGDKGNGLIAQAIAKQIKATADADFSIGQRESKSRRYRGMMQH